MDYIENPSFVSFPLLSGVSRYYSAFNSIEKIINENKQNKITVFCYSLHLPFLKCCHDLKLKHGASFDFIPIVPDLPFFSSHYKGLKGRVYSFYKNIEVKSVKKFCSHACGYIFFAEEMKVFFNDKKPYSVINGLPPNIKNSNITLSSNFADYNLPEDYIFYAGGLSEEYGVKDLIDSFCLLKSDFPDLNLVLCGKGALDNYINEKINIGYSIIHLGVVSNEQSKFLQSNAKILVNPRKPDLEFTRYSFPSKMFEYLHARKPIVGYRLPAYDDKFSKLIIIAEMNNQMGLYNALIKGLTITQEEYSNLQKQISSYLIDEVGPSKIYERQ